MRITRGLPELRYSLYCAKIHRCKMRLIRLRPAVSVRRNFPRCSINCNQLRLVAEGECLSEPATSQLRDFLQGMVILAQNGLNDPQLRKQMNPDEREAYLEILKSADIQKIDRGEWKSVRVVLAITPRFLDMAGASAIARPATDTSSPPETSKKNAASGKTKAPKKK